MIRALYRFLIAGESTERRRCRILDPSVCRESKEKQRISPYGAVFEEKGAGSRRSQFSGREGGFGAFDPAAPQDSLVLVNHARLARGYSSLGVGQRHRGTSPTEPENFCRYGGLVGTELDLDLDRLGRKRAVTEPVDILDRQFGAHERLARADDDAPIGGVDTDDVQRLAPGDAEATALADRETGDPVVDAEGGAIDVDNWSRGLGLGSQARDGIDIGSLGNETDVLAVRLFGDREGEFGRHRAGLVLVHLAQWKPQPLQLIGGGCEKKITLVPTAVGGAVQFDAGVSHHSARVMAGRQSIGAEFGGGFEQVAKLDRLIASYARNGRFSAQIGGGEIVDHLGLEAAFVIEDVVGNFQGVRDPARVADVLACAAGALAADRSTVIVELQGDADDLVSPARQ